MSTRRRKHSTNDLFEIFPDLPWTRRRATAEKNAQAQRQVEAVRESARLSIVRQPGATERVLAAPAGFRRRK